MTGAARLVVVSDRARLPLTSELAIGRDPGTGLHVDSPHASKRHARIFHRDGRWWIEDSDSMNGTYVDGLRIEAPVALQAGMAIEVGGRHLRIEREHSSGAATPGARVVRIGRDRANDVVVPDPTVSRFHAELRTEPGGMQLRDLGSCNGTRVDGREIEVATVTPASRVGIGAHLLRLDQLAIPPRRQAGALSATAVRVRAGGRTILQPTSLRAHAGELIAIIGGTGTGKSTLLKVLAGALQPDDGRVELDGEPLALRLTDIGYVPQRPILHSGLTAREALTYGARLRLPPDMSASEIESAVARTLAELKLAGAAETLVKQLSGGEEKRVSLALELLGAPRMLLLDEPTSGLDIYHQTTLMRMLREIADGGRAVIVITHTLAEIEHCDRVLVMGGGGRLRFDGRPHDALAHFNACDFFAVFEHLQHEPQPEHGPDRPPPSGVRARAPARAGTRPAAHHTRVLAARGMRLLVRDRVTTGLLLGQIPLLALLARLIFGAGSFAPSHGNSSKAAQMLFVLAIVATFVGVFDGLRTFVSERSVWERERAIGVLPSSYLASKLATLGPLALLQALALGSVAFLLVPPHRSGTAIAAMLALLVLTTWAALALGLFVSALASSEARAVTAALPLLVLELLLAGGIVSVKEMGAVGLGSLVVSARWSLAGTGAALRLNRAPGADRGFLHHYGHAFFATRPGVTALALLALVAVPLLATHRTLERQRLN